MPDQATGTIASSVGPKVGDAAHSDMIANLDAKESARKVEDSRKWFYEQMGAKPPKDGEADISLNPDEYVPGEARVKVPEKAPKAEKRGERKAQPALTKEKPVEVPAEEEPADEEAADEAPEAEEETTEEGVSPDSEETEAESDDEEASSDLEEEATILRRAKVPMSVVKKLSREESSRLAGILKGTQATIDDLGRQLGEAKKMESEDDLSAESGRVTPPEQPAKKSTVEPLLQVLGEDAAPALSEYDKSIDDRVKQAETRLAGMYLDDLLDDARESLKEQFPEVLNDRFFQGTIRQEMSVLGQSKLTKLSGTTKRARIQSLMERALLNAREAKGLGNGRAEKAPAAPARKHGTVSPPKRVQAQPKVGTVDRAEAAWGLLMQNIAPKEAKRRLDSRM